MDTDGECAFECRGSGRPGAAAEEGNRAEAGRTGAVPVEEEGEEVGGPGRGGG